MKYVRRVSLVTVVGNLWMPNVTSFKHIALSDYDIENMRNDDGSIDRDGVEDWLGAHTGDFSKIIDFSASIEDGNETIDIPFATEEGECAYLDTLPEED